MEQNNTTPDDLASSETIVDEPAAPGARQFPCKNCGGPLLFRPDSTLLKCPYCGTENDIPLDAADEDHLRENDFLAELEKKASESTADTPETEAARCTSCGATTTVTSEKTADRCPYCDNPLTIQNHASSKLKVQAILPFVIDEDQAKVNYRKWLSTRWFAPSDFSRRATREEALKGIYMPFWTYDANTQTWYTGQRGDAYYVTVQVTVTRDNKTVTEPRQERRIRWSSAAGNVKVPFDDILIPASHSLPSGMQDSLQPWQLQNIKPFRQEFLAGFVAETYQVPLKDGFEEAQRRMQPAIDQAIKRDIGGDEQRINSKTSRYSQVTFKHILLPVWISAYRYQDKTYRFMINAQTGEATGDRPWSYWKIAGAVLVGAAILGAIVHFLQ